MDLQLKNKVVLVTGGAKGIGLGVAEVLAAEGAIPVIVGRNAADNQLAVRAIEGAGNAAWSVVAELNRTEDCRRAVESTVEKFGRIEGLVNNAGINDGVSLEQGDTERFIASLRKNLIHYYEMAQFALPELKKSKG